VGLSPTAELLFQAGCRMRYVGSLGGYVAEHDRYLRTSIPEILVAGDVSGIEEASTAMLEGRLAGTAACMDLPGTIDRDGAESLLEALQQKLIELRQGPFGAKTRAGKKEITNQELVIPESFVPIERKPMARKRPPGQVKGTARAVVECYEEIPCNPCQDACPTGALRIEGVLTNLPRLDPELCTGCGKCITSCPGLAIFVMDKEYAPERALIMLPYEFLPVPQVGEKVQALDRSGRVRYDAEVVKVRQGAKQDRIVVISISVPRELADEVRFIRPYQWKWEDFQARPFRPGEDHAEEPTVCMCEDVKQSEVERFIDEGLYTVEEIKRVLRCGMGACQGRTCSRLIAQLIARKTGRPISEIKRPTVRPPLSPVPLGTIGMRANE
jgi:ferredoxin